MSEQRWSELKEIAARRANSWLKSKIVMQRRLKNELAIFKENICGNVPSHTAILPIHVWAVPYAYGQPIRVLAAHTRTGSPYAYGLPIRVRVAHIHARMGENSCFAHMRMSGHMCIGMLDHTSTATAMT